VIHYESLLRILLYLIHSESVLILFLFLIQFESNNKLKTKKDKL